MFIIVTMSYEYEKNFNSTLQICPVYQVPSSCWKRAKGSLSHYPTADVKQVKNLKSEEREFV